MEPSRLTLRPLESFSDLIVNLSEIEKDGQINHPGWYSAVDP